MLIVHVYNFFISFQSEIMKRSAETANWNVKQCFPLLQMKPEMKKTHSSWPYAFAGNDEIDGIWCRTHKYCSWFGHLCAPLCTSAKLSADASHLPSNTREARDLYEFLYSFYFFEAFLSENRFVYSTSQNLPAVLHCLFIISTSNIQGLSVSRLRASRHKHLRSQTVDCCWFVRYSKDPH